MSGKEIRGPERGNKQGGWVFMKRRACLMIVQCAKIWRGKIGNCLLGSPKVKVHLLVQFGVIYKNFRSPLSHITKTRKFPTSEILSYTCVLFLSVKYLHWFPMQTSSPPLAFLRCHSCLFSLTSIDTLKKKTLGLNLNHSLSSILIALFPFMSKSSFLKTFYFILEYAIGLIKDSQVYNKVIQKSMATYLFFSKSFPFSWAYNKWAFRVPCAMVSRPCWLSIFLLFALF